MVTSLFSVFCWYASFHDSEHPPRTNFHDFWDILQGYGYTIKRICLGGILLKIETYYEDLEYFRGVSNYLATFE